MLHRAFCHRGLDASGTVHSSVLRPTLLVQDSAAHGCEMLLLRLLLLMLSKCLCLLLLPLLNLLLVLLPRRICLLLNLLLVLQQCLLLSQFLLLIEYGDAHVLGFSAAAAALKFPRRVDETICTKIWL